ncbi:MAG: PASTA domain-containing protein, partial [Actinobacteria bacterium]|nr:PASTA domain-containing protein [Actinomycetota bacterium]
LAIAYKHLSDRVPPPSKLVVSVPPELDRVVLHATEKDRDRRPATAAEMRKELLVAGGHVPPANPLPEVIARLPEPDELPDDRAATVTIPRMLAPRARRKRRRRRFLVVLLVLAVLAGGGWAGWTYLVPHYGTVPNVLGMSVTEARATLEGAGFRAEIGTSVFSTEYADGAVARQSVAGGEEARLRSTVILRPSKGPPLIVVPSLSGKNAKQAARTLRAEDLELGEVREAYSDRIPPGKVIDQNPSAGTSIPFGSEVDIVVSLGPEPITVPNVTGLTFQEASAVLLSAGLGVTKVEEHSTEVGRGVVISQDPGQGAELAEGEPVTVVVSLGPREFDMPNVIGESTADARARLEGLGLVVDVVTLPGLDGGEVVYTDPPAGTTVQEGDTVTIYDA